MRWLFLFLWLSCPLLSAMPTISTLKGQLSSSKSIHLLRLDECILPCWINIIPGSTTLNDAQAHVEHAYGDTSLYVLKNWENYYVITDTSNGSQLRIVLDLNSENITGDTVVRSIHLEPINSNRSGIERPLIADLAQVLGNPEMVQLASGVEVPTTVLIYQGQRVYISVDNLECDRVHVNQTIRSIVLSAEPLIHVAWLSEPEEWIGYDYCYNFERRLS